MEEMVSKQRRTSQEQSELTFKNCGVTSRTVAMRQTCSSSDDCKVLGNVNSRPLQEDVGTVSHRTRNKLLFQYSTL